MILRNIVLFLSVTGRGTEMEKGEEMSVLYKYEVTQWCLQELTFLEFSHHSVTQFWNSVITVSW